MHIVLGVITFVMVATQPDATAAAGGASALGFFVLDGLAYIVLATALHHPAFARIRRSTRWALIALTAVTIVAYVALIQGRYDVTGIADKFAEMVLIVLVTVEGRRARQAPVPAT